MKNDELAFAPIAEVARLIQKRRLSPLELTKMVLDRIENLNPKLNAYLTVTADLALEQARKAEHVLAGPQSRGRYLGPLHGLPISVKDNIYTAGVRTTAGSKILADFVPHEDATVVLRLRAAGAVVLGKTNLHEFAYGVTTNNPYYGPARNPWDLDRIPGGSSGGSAAAVAAGLGYGSIGTDTGGSVRIPAALSGIVGLKPTFGRVSCHNVVPLASSLDHVGPLGRTVADTATLLSAIAGFDPADEKSASSPVPDYTAALRRRIRTVRLGWPREYFWEVLDEEVHRIVEDAAKSFEKLGATIQEVSLPHLRESDDPATHLALAEARAHHEAAGWYPARALDYSEEVRDRLELGGNIRAVEYLRAATVRRQLQADFAVAFQMVDAILAPTVPIAAPRIGERRVRIDGHEESVRNALLRLNRPANLTGLPAISIPCGFTRTALPVGLQLIGGPFGEAKLLRIAYLYECAHQVPMRPSV